MDKVYSRSYTLQSEEKFRDEYLGTFSPPIQCATKIVSTGEQCQNEGVKYIGDTTTGEQKAKKEYLCKQCYQTFIHRIARQWLDEFNRNEKRYGVDTLPQDVQLDILGIKLQHKKPALFELKTWTI